MTNTNNNDIDALLRRVDPHCEFCGFIDAVDCARYHRALSALVAERDALRKRIEELESRPPASDLRERLVCAIWPEILRQWREYTGAIDPQYTNAIDPRGNARSDALQEADKMLVAMRKGEAHGK